MKWIVKLVLLLFTQKCNTFRLYGWRCDQVFCTEGEQCVIEKDQLGQYPICRRKSHVPQAECFCSSHQTCFPCVQPIYEPRLNIDAFSSIGDKINFFDDQPVEPPTPSRFLQPPAEEPSRTQSVFIENENSPKSPENTSVKCHRDQYCSITKECGSKCDFKPICRFLRTSTIVTASATNNNQQLLVSHNYQIHDNVNSIKCKENELCTLKTLCNGLTCEAQPVCISPLPLTVQEISPPASNDLPSESDLPTESSIATDRSNHSYPAIKCQLNQNCYISHHCKKNLCQVKPVCSATVQSSKCRPNEMCSFEANCSSWPCEVRPACVTSSTGVVDQKSVPWFDLKRPKQQNTPIKETATTQKLSPTTVSPQYHPPAATPPDSFNHVVSKPPQWSTTHPPPLFRPRKPKATIVDPLFH